MKGMRVGGLRSTSRLRSYHSSARPGSFQARDNISQFIGWCRSTLAVPDTLLFETEDLVTRRNERNVLLCLLEVQYSRRPTVTLSAQLKLN